MKIVILGLALAAITSPAFVADLRSDDAPEVSACAIPDRAACAIPFASQTVCPECEACTRVCDELTRLAAAICIAAAAVPHPASAATCAAAEAVAFATCLECDRICEECADDDDGPGGGGNRGGGDDDPPPGEICESGHYSSQGFCCDEWYHVPKPGGGFAEMCVVYS